MEAFPYLHGRGTTEKAKLFIRSLDRNIFFCTLYLLMLDLSLKNACLYANVVNYVLLLTTSTGKTKQLQLK